MKTIQEDSEISSNLPGALEVYRAAWLILTKAEISVEEIDVQETGLGLIGSGNRRLPKLLEILFGWSCTFRLHAWYHDVFHENEERARLYLHLQKLYIERSPLFGHLTGLLSCILFGKKYRKNDCE